MQAYHSASGSAAEDLFIDLFSETFGVEKAGYLYSQYHFYDIYTKQPLRRLCPGKRSAPGGHRDRR